MDNVTQNSNGKVQNQNAKAKGDLKSRCYTLGLDIIQFLDLLPKKRACWTISDQLLRSSTSIGANVHEATAASSKLDFKKFFEVALKSANESIFWLNLLRDAQLSDKHQTDKLIRETTEISRILGASILTMKGKNQIRS